jgi:hypothetical protein
MTPQQIAQLKRVLSGQAQAVLDQLERILRQVSGDPSELSRAAERYGEQADQVQRSFDRMLGQANLMRGKWKGDDYREFDRRSRELFRPVRLTVRDLRERRTRLLGVSTQMADSIRRVQKAITEYRQQVVAILVRVNQEPVGLADELHRKGLVALSEARSASMDLATILALDRGDSLYRNWFGRPIVERLLVGHGGAPTPDTAWRRAPGSRPQTFEFGTEFDASMEYLRWRISSDPRSDVFAAFNGACLLSAMRMLRSLAAPRGDWDLKEAFDMLFGMTDRNNMHTPLPIELGDIHGHQGEIDRDFLGNVHYGYMIAAIGYPRPGELLAWGADIGQDGRGDPGDAIAVRIGRELYGRYPPETLTPERFAEFDRDLREAIRRNFAELVRVGKIRIR